MRRLSAVLCLLLAMLVAVGCGGGGDSSSTNASGGDPNKPVTLEVWDWGNPDPEAQRTLDVAYERQHPNVTIKRVHHPFDSMFTLLRSAVAARRGPDIFMSYASPFVFDYANGIRPLNDLVTREDLENLEGWDYTKKGDDYMAMPIYGSGTMWYYNRELFERAGLDPNAAPRTWDEMLNTCDRLKAAGITPIVAGWKDGYYAEWWGAQMAHQYQTDEELAKAANDPDWTDDAFRKTFDLINDLYERGCFTKGSEGIPLFPNAVDSFKAGEGAMFLGLPSSDIHWGAFTDTKWGKRGNLGAFLPPLVPDSLWDEQRINYVPANAYAITRWSPNAEAAYAYMRYLASPQSQDRLEQLVGQFSNNKLSRAQPDNPIGRQIVEWANTKENYAGQVLLIRSTVQALYDKFIPALVTGQQRWDDIADQLQAVQAKSNAQ